LSVRFSSGARKDNSFTRASDSGINGLLKSSRFSPPMMSSTRQPIRSDAANAPWYV
jgi:hypothetical protein